MLLIFLTITIITLINYYLTYQFTVDVVSDGILLISLSLYVFSPEKSHSILFPIMVMSNSHLFYLELECASFNVNCHVWNKSGIETMDYMKSRLWNTKSRDMISL